MDASDSELMERIARGDPKAFDAFYQRHLRVIRNVLYRMLMEPADVEDVLQETFLQLWNKSWQYNADKASPAGYLTMVARSRALDLIRKRKPDADPKVCEPTFQYDISLGLVRDESIRKVRMALSKLPFEQRKVVRLAFMTGLTHEQIAVWLKLPLGTVKTRIRLGLRRLKTLIPDE
ncbi:MAG: sigma-70 family RNA polymerase sigma factor [Gemmataceae bacterium]|nr:sigma-70 family RNA polymerase sigma factor [Gemmataceae bacterium]